ncbi:Clp protease N-terminal domain-containing protein [Thermoactinospora rubra]|uniref:Clp protease N-terminal domain-containing protein n=1 Tax=Thermoactinospora rubra TaxID=1088767 RepID=UPI000A0F6C53
MFERFSDRARRVVVLAQDEARMLHHNYIGTEHILLGLLHDHEGLACQVLRDAGVDLETVRRAVKDIIGVGATEVAAGHIPFTPRAKKVLELSLREALQLHHTYIGTEHILLGLIREGEGVAAQVLTGQGLNLADLRERVVERIRHKRPGAEHGRSAVERELLERLDRIQQSLDRIEARLEALEGRRDSGSDQDTGTDG